MGQHHLNLCLNSTGFVFGMRELSNVVIWLFSDSCRFLRVETQNETKKESPIITEANVVSGAPVKYLFFLYISVVCLHYPATSHSKSQCSSQSLCFINEISAASSSAVEPIFVPRHFCMSLGCA